MEIKRTAKRVLKNKGIKINMCDMILLEYHALTENVFGVDVTDYDYIYLDDIKTGKGYQIFDCGTVCRVYDISYSDR